MIPRLPPAAHTGKARPHVDRAFFLGCDDCEPTPARLRCFTKPLYFPASRASRDLSARMPAHISQGRDPMATRHLSVALIVLLIGCFSSGCFLFGGGGKKD